MYQKGISPEFARNLAFARKNRGPSLGIFSLFSCVWGGKKGQEKTRAQPWYARNSGKSPGQMYPKDPAVLKILRRVNLLGVANLLSHSDLLSWRTVCGHLFPGNCKHLSPQRGVHGVVNLGGIVKTLRRSNSLSRSVFSTAGSFGQ